MENQGFIHEHLDIKILILFVLSKLPGPIDGVLLSDLCRIDEGVGYFDYSECLIDLIETGHVEKTADGYAITDKGRRNSEAVSSSLPYSVRMKTAELLKPIEARIRREAMIKTGYSSEGNMSRVNLCLSDGAGEILNLSFLCPDEKTASTAVSRFTESAEEYYLKIVELFCED